MKFTVDTRNRDFIDSLADQTSAVIPALTLGDKFPVSFEFGKDGALDESIGVLDTVEVALSSCVTPDRGTFTLSAPGGPITGEPLTLPATTSAKALASAMAASWDGVSLSDLCITGKNGFFRVEFQGNLADTEIDAMTGDGTKLAPRSVVSVSQKEAGGGGQNAVQIISLDSVPLAYADDLTLDDGVFSGILNVDTVAANEAMREAGKGRVSRLLSVRVTDDEGNRTTYAKRPVIVDCTGIPMGPFGGGVLAKYLTIKQGDNRYPRVIDGELKTQGEIEQRDPDDRIIPAPPLLQPRVPTGIYARNEGLSRSATNQWVTLIVQHKNDLYGSAVGWGIKEATAGVPVSTVRHEQSGIHCWQAIDGGMMESNIKTILHRSDVGVQGTDEHNAATPLLDVRPNARYPLMFFQNEHNKSVPGTQLARSRTFDVGGLEGPEIILPEETHLNYGQAFRNPINQSEIVNIVRQGGVNNDWMLIYSKDDGETWSIHPLIDGAYVLARPMRNDRGLWLVLHKHPTHLSAGDQRILLLQFRWIDGSLRIPDTLAGTVAVPSVYLASDTYDAFADESAFVVRTPETDMSTRLFDCMETQAGNLEIVLAEFERVAAHGDTYSGKDREYRHIRINTSNMTVATDTVIPMDPGWPMETPTGQNYYFTGLSIVSAYNVIATSWLPTGETVQNSEDEIGEGKISQWVSDDAGDNWTETVIDTLTNAKAYRPATAIRYQWYGADRRQYWYPGRAVVYHAGSFIDMDNWDSRTKVIDV